MVYIGVDLGGTKITAALFDMNGEIADSKVALLEGRKGEAVANLMTELISGLIKQHKIGGREKKSIGICVPGIAYSKKGTVWCPNIPEWDDFPLQEYIGLAIPNSVICIESDRTCYILGEVIAGCAKKCDNAVFMAVGTGIGLGILVDGMVLHGNSDIVGAIGWMALKPPYDSFYDKCGCFETHASGDGLAVQAKKFLDRTPEYKGELREVERENISSYHVFRAYENGDEIAVKVIDQAIEMWGMAAANVVSLFNPQILVFGGGVFGPATQFIERIYEEACKWAQPISIKEVKFMPTALPKLAGLYGAGAIAINISQKKKK